MIAKAKMSLLKIKLFFFSRFCHQFLIFKQNLLNSELEPHKTLKHGGDLGCMAATGMSSKLVFSDGLWIGLSIKTFKKEFV